jgi:subtilisin family serine protease
MPLNLIATLALATTVAATEPPASAKVSAMARAELARGGSAPLLVSFADGRPLAEVLAGIEGDARVAAAVAHLKRQAQARQSATRQLLEREGITYRPFWIANFIALEGDAELATRLAARPEVKTIELDVRMGLDPVQPAFPQSTKAPSAIEPGVSLVNAPALWAMGFRGQGVLVAGQDTGYQWDHPALRNQYAGWNGTSADHDYHWKDTIASGGGSCGPAASAPCDDNNHGTHTMGTIVGDDGGANQIGVAPGARWIGCRNMDQGAGTPSTYAACFQWFMAPTRVDGSDPDPSRAPHLINNSWGCPPSEGCNTPNILQTVVENTRTAGILVVASAGNSGSSCSTVVDPPAIYAASFVVGAISPSTRAMAGFSSRGPVTVDGSNRIKPDIVAPGVSTRSAVRGGGYASFQGTSMAGPHVAGVAALLMSVDPGLRRDPARVEQILKDTAVADVVTSQTCGGIPPTTIPNPVFGYGRVDALTAVRNGLGLYLKNGFE